MIHSLIKIFVALLILFQSYRLVYHILKVDEIKNDLQEGNSKYDKLINECSQICDFEFSKEELIRIRHFAYEVIPENLTEKHFTKEYLELLVQQKEVDFRLESLLGDNHGFYVYKYGIYKDFYSNELFIGVDFRLTGKCQSYNLEVNGQKFDYNSSDIYLVPKQDKYIIEYSKYSPNLHEIRLDTLRLSRTLHVL